MALRDRAAPEVDTAGGAETLNWPEKAALFSAI